MWFQRRDVRPSGHSPCYFNHNSAVTTKLLKCISCYFALGLVSRRLQPSQTTETPYFIKGVVNFAHGLSWMWSWGSDSSGDWSPVKVEGLTLWLVPVLGVLLLGIASVFDLRKIFTKTPGQAGGAPHLTSSRLQRVSSDNSVCMAVALSKWSLVKNTSPVLTFVTGTHHRICY